MVVVLSLGGSFLFDRPDDVKRLKNLLDSIDEKFVITVGGGKICREYLDFAKRLPLSEEELHSVCTEITRVNAFTVSKALKAQLFVGNPAKLKADTKITVTGGFKPGWTTDVCAAKAAAALKSKYIINLSKERGVYDKDPEKFEDAKLLKKLTFKQLYDLTPGDRKPGMNFIFDPMAGSLCEKAGISVIVTNKIEDIAAVLDGNVVDGSTISATITKSL